MKLLSIQVGKIETHDYNGEAWTTAYYKAPVSGSVRVNTLSVAGDEQHNKQVHGGVHRAVLMYSAENYARWTEELKRDFDYGAFAENFTVSGMDEASVCLGDIYQIGDVVRLQVAQPRQPCYQIYRALGVRGISKKVTQTHRTGWYLRVLQAGNVQAGMSIKRLERPYPEWTIQRCHTVMNERATRRAEAGQLAAITELEPGWRKKLAAIAEQA